MSQPAQLHSLSLDYVEALLAQYRRDPASLDEQWRRYFDSLAAAGELGDGALAPSLQPPSLFGGNGAATPAASVATAPPARPAPPPPAPEPATRTARAATPTLTTDVELQRRVDDMIRNYRIRGHLFANINPLRNPPALPEELELEGLGIKESDLDRTVSTAGIPGADTATVREVMERMRETYCQYISAEFMHIDDLKVRSWLQERMEISRNRVHLDRREQVRILKKLIDAAVFEEFIQRKYLGAKSFSLEGAESLIPLLDLAIEKVAEQGAIEIVFGMSHRGRLNVLANIIGKPTRDIFREFEDLDAEQYIGGGDVKYHMGHSSDWTTDLGRRIHLSLSFNPSHLEFINPVAMGRVRAKQDRIGNELRDRAALFLIHGDAAFAGEGIVQESLNLSQLPAYTIGGALHVVVNNQIGFTTPPESSRSNTYCTDVAKMLQVPIFHVNGEYPEAVAQVVNVALDFRQRYQRDVVIDLYCYRRRGHNEGDEPAFTQPMLYDGIRARDPVRVHYLEHLLELGEIKPEEAEIYIEREEKRLEGALATARRMNEKTSPQAYDGVWNAFVGGRTEDIPEPDTGAPEAKLRGYLKRLVELPEGFNLHRNLRRFIAARAEMAEGKRPLDWAAAEALAFAATADSGQRVRLTGQDCERGTFSQRHSVLHDRVTDENYRPLMNAAKNQEAVEIYNSPLSEGRRARFRIRLQPRLPGRTGALGSAVRRLRERGAGDHRSVHHQRRGQVEPAQRPRPSAAPRFRGAGARALERPDRALAIAGRRRERPDRLPLDAGTVLPPAAPAGGAGPAQAADRVYPEEACCAARKSARSWPTWPRAATSPCCPTRRSEPTRRGRRSAASCSAPARSSTTWTPTAGRSAPTITRSCAWSSSTPLRNRNSTRRWPSSRPMRRFAGCRRNRGTWAPGPTCGSTSAF